MNSIRQCPVCRSPQTDPFLSRRGVPVHQNMLFRSQEEAVAMKRGELHLLICEHCGFIYNASFEPSKLEYGAAYNNSQNFSPAFHRYTNSLAAHIAQRMKGSGKRIIEVGCGKATFLHQLFELDEEMTGYGFDPSYEGPETAYNGRLRFVKDIYGPKYESIRADFVVCRHVIEHIPDPVRLLGSIRKALSQSPHALVFFETPCVEWILRHTAVWDFFYEHCSYFSPFSLSKAFAESGFRTGEIRHIFQGQYLWLEASLAHDGKDGGIAAEGDRLDDAIATVKLARAYRERESAVFERWRNRLFELAHRGKPAVWGAGAKGVTFANLFDPHREQIACIVDANPGKQGGYLPGTGHPIVSYTELRRLGITDVLLMNPNYKEEVLQIAENHRLPIKLTELE